MKSILSLVTAALCAASLSAQTVLRMDSLTAGGKAAATAVRLTGKLSVKGNSDFRQLRDLCWQLKSADLSAADCPVVPANALHSRHRLETLLLPRNAVEIGSQAFYACTALRTLVVPASVRKIETAAFSGCTAMTSLTIEGTPAIGDFAFANLTSLTTLTVKSATPPAAAENAFEGIDAATCRLVVPAGSEEAYRNAPGWSRFFGAERAWTSTCSPEKALLPVPVSLKVDRNAPALDAGRAWRIKAAKELGNELDQASALLAERLGSRQAVSKGTNTLTLSLDPSLSDDEAYTLTVSEKAVDIKGRTPAGVFYGLMTLDQLLRGTNEAAADRYIPQTEIADAPRTHIRELMVDPVRIFIPFEELKGFVTEMSRYKYNALHLHLVDDQAWRIEIKKYPELTAAGSARVGMDDMQMPVSGFYTQEQMKELVAFAAGRHVQIVPEIEMPGHEVAAVHVFPQLTCGSRLVPIRTTCGVSNELLCPGSDFTYEFLGNVFRELADIFPSPYIHLGGDEAGQPALGCWTDCAKCRALKRRLGINEDRREDNWQLQKYLFDAVIDTLRTKYGKTPMFWYETDFKEIQPGCVTFAWRHGLTRAAADAAVRNNARIMLCPGEHCYLDYPMAAGDMPEVNWGMPTTPLAATYALDPSWGLGDDFERNNLFGVAGTLWSECINSPERIYYQAYPRAHALAEVGWSAAKDRNYDNFLLRLRPVIADMVRRGVSVSLRF